MSLHVNYTVNGKEASAFFPDIGHPQTDEEYEALKARLGSSKERSVVIRIMSEGPIKDSELLLG